MVAAELPVSEPEFRHQAPGMRLAQFLGGLLLQLKQDFGPRPPGQGGPSGTCSCL